MKAKEPSFPRIDGLSNFIRSDSIIFKIFYMLLFLCLASACLYFLVNDVLTFASFQVTTTYRLQTQTKANFPTISICSLNPLNSDYYMQLLQQTNVNVSNNEAFYNFLSLESAYKNMTGKFLNQEQKMSLFDWDGFIISCKFGNKVCNSSHFGRLYFPYDLSCLVFNSGRHHNNINAVNAIPFQEVNIGGDAHSLTMELYVGLPNQLASIVSKRGVLVRIIESNEDLYKYSPSPINISYGLASKIGVKRNVYDRFNAWPYLYVQRLHCEQGWHTNEATSEPFIIRLRYLDKFQIYAQ